jgi:multidrug transporter EmrE-like cation transporter
VTPKLFSWAVLLVAVAANVTANVSLKLAMTSPPSDEGGRSLLRVLSLGSFWVGLLAAGVLLVSYLLALRTIAVSTAYVAVTSLAMIGLVLAERKVFGAPIDASKLAGMACVVVGVWLLARTPQ